MWTRFHTSCRGFELITLSADGQGYNAYKNGAFLIFYGQKANGEQGWYLFDSENHIYQRYGLHDRRHYAAG